MILRAEPAERTPRRPAEAPWPVRGYLAIQILGVAAWVLFGGDVLRGVGGLVIGGAVGLGILFGHRAAWVLAIIFAAVGALGTIGFVMTVIAGKGLEPEQWSSVGVYVVSLVLLLHPLTHAWVSRPAAASVSPE